MYVPSGGMRNLDLRALLDDWEIALRAQRKSPRTLRTYLFSANAYLDWCATGDRPVEITKANVNAWIAENLDAGWSDATAVVRQAGIRRFSAWLANEDDIPVDADPLLGLKRPKVDEQVIEPISAEQVVALIEACAVPRNATDYQRFAARRDEASIRFLAETGTRVGEFLAMTVPDTDVKDGSAVIRRGKGGKGRRVPFGAQTAEALSRYMRLRRAHKLADTHTLWLGARNRNLTYDGLRHSLYGRADAAGIEGFHIHRLRHSFADRWLSADGSEAGLMAVAGWSRPDMLLRYTKARKEARAAEEARRLGLGDL